FADTCYRDSRGKAVRIHLRAIGNIKNVCAVRLQLLRVAFFCPWIVCEIFGAVELLRVYKESDDHSVGCGASGLDQAEMPSMQCAHCGNHTDSLAGASPGFSQGAQLGLGADDLHLPGSS